MEENAGWYRRKLPHFDGGNTTQFITFSLDDSLPQDVLENLRQELKDMKGNVERIRHDKIQHFLDQGAGSCILREPRCAEVVRDSLMFLDGQHFDLISWVVMPNHVHFLARFDEGKSLPTALHALKSYTAHELNKIHPEMMSIWHVESYDRFIRDEEHFWNTVSYIHRNPIIARLCKKPSEYRWSSAFVDLSE
jgi:putative transposase